MVEKILVGAHSCNFRGMYTRQVWKSRSIQFLRYMYSGFRHTDGHFTKPFTVTLPKGEGQKFSFQDKVGKPFVDLVKDNISNQFSSSKDVITSFSTFDTNKIPNLTSPELLSYGEDSMETLINHYAKDLPAETVQGVEFIKEAIISQDIRTEWKTYRQLISKQTEGQSIVTAKRVSYQ